MFYKVEYWIAGVSSAKNGRGSLSKACFAGCETHPIQQKNLFGKNSILLYMALCHKTNILLARFKAMKNIVFK